MGLTFVLTGGGTGGHIYPALAVREALEDKGAGDCVWIGSSTGMEKTIVRHAGITFHGVPAGKLRRYLSLRNLTDVFRTLAGIGRSLGLLYHIRPAVVFAKGGYVTVPVVLAAAFLRIPVVIHESDVSPGLATRINSRFARRIAVAYEASRGYYGRSGKIVVTGNPVRRALFLGDARGVKRRLGLPEEKPLVLVLGGSQGAAEVNGLIEASLDELLAKASVVHQMGPANFKPSDRAGWVTAPYFGEELADLLATADLVVGRAGAGAIWENGVLGKPAVLIPLGSSGSRGDQLENAGIFAEAGAAVVLEGADVNPEALKKAVLSILNDGQKRETMAQAAKRLTVPDAAGRIADILIEEARR